MTPKQFSDIAADEIFERAGGLSVAVEERCELEGCPFTAEQKKFLRTGILQAFMGVGDVLESMTRAAEVLSRFTGEVGWSEFERWLADQDGRRH